MSQTNPTSNERTFRQQPSLDGKEVIAQVSMLGGWLWITMKDTGISDLAEARKLRDWLNSVLPPDETTEPVHKFTGKREDPCTLCGHNAWSHACPPTNNGPLGSRRVESSQKAKGDCAHRWAPTIAGDQRMCIDCGARRPAQKANDSPTSTGE